MAVSVTISRMNLGPCKRAVDMGTDAHRRRLALAAGRGMNPYVPFRTGQLARDAHPGVGVVTYPTDYAIYVFDPHRPIHIHRDRHPKATSRWDRKYSADGAKEVCEEVLRIVSGH